MASPSRRILPRLTGHEVRRWQGLQVMRDMETGARDGSSHTPGDWRSLGHAAGRVARAAGLGQHLSSPPKMRGMPELEWVKVFLGHPKVIKATRRTHVSPSGLERVPGLSTPGAL
jgi:hypothetical protein